MYVKRSTLYWMLIILIFMTVLVISMILGDWKTAPTVADTTYPKVYMVDLAKDAEIVDNGSAYVVQQQNGELMELNKNDTVLEWIYNTPGIPSYVMVDENEYGASYILHVREDDGIITEQEIQMDI